MPRKLVVDTGGRGEPSLSGDLSVVARKVAKQRGSAASRIIIELAARQHGVAAVRQLSDVSWEAIRAAQEAGWLRRVHQGVYSLSTPPTHRRIWMAAALACGDGAVLSHVSAAALWRIQEAAQGPSHVTVRTEGGRAKRRAIVVHRRNGLLPSELSERDGIPVTSPARTLFDLASTGVTPRALERAADEAERLWRPAVVAHRIAKALETR